MPLPMEVKGLMIMKLLRIAWPIFARRISSARSLARFRKKVTCFQVVALQIQTCDLPCLRLLLEILFRLVVATITRQGFFFSSEMCLIFLKLFSFFFCAIFNFFLFPWNV